MPTNEIDLDETTGCQTKGAYFQESVWDERSNQPHWQRQQQISAQRQKKQEQQIIIDALTFTFFIK